MQDCHVKLKTTLLFIDLLYAIPGKKKHYTRHVLCLVVETDMHGNMAPQPHPPPSYLLHEGEPLPAYTVYAAS